MPAVAYWPHIYLSQHERKAPPLRATNKILISLPGGFGAHLSRHAIGETVTSPAPEGPRALTTRATPKRSMTQALVSR